LSILSNVERRCYASSGGCRPLADFIKGDALKMQSEMDVARADISGVERKDALAYIDKVERELEKTVGGFSKAQWHFKPAPEVWSAAENLEHLAIVAERMKELLAALNQQLPAPGERGVKAEDARILATTVDRSVKFPAPEAARPTRNLPPELSLEQIRSTNGLLRMRLESSRDLRKQGLPHPVFGLIDGYQWTLVATGHISRHVQQIAELKADPKYPRA
jgi:hypothetical protein